MTFPWKLLVTSIMIGLILRPIFPDNTDYMIAAFVSGVLLGIGNVVFKIGLEK